MKKKAILIGMSMLCCIAFAACGSKGNEDKDPLTGEELGASQEESSSQEESQSTDPNEFDQLLQDSTEPSGIINYINENIGTASNEDSDRYLGGLLHFGDDVRNIDFTQLEDSRQYLPEDMIAFMELMKLEADTPSMVMSDEEDRKVIGMTLTEMLERALLFEQHLDKYPDQVTTQPAKTLYEEIVTAAITGGYDREQGVEHYYQGDTPDVVDEESMEYYRKFAEANSDSRLGKLVFEYMTLLSSNQFQINDTLEGFYQTLMQRLDGYDTEDSLNTNTETTQSGDEQESTGAGNGTAATEGTGQ